MSPTKNMTLLGGRAFVITNLEKGTAGRSGTPPSVASATLAAWQLAMDRAISDLIAAGIDPAKTSMFATMIMEDD